MSASRLKTALLAAASLTAASVAGVSAAAQAAPLAPVAVEHAVTAADHETDRPASLVTAKTVGIAAAATAALAAFFRLIGARRLKAAAAVAARAAGRAASAGADIALSAGKAVARAVSSPLRFVAVLGGLALVSLAGVGFYDVEWAGGLVFGALTAITAIIGARRVCRALSVVRTPRR